MTFVDDTLQGPSTLRSARPGSKSAETNAAGQRAAFENAFADAGKKKQPVIANTGKPIAEASTKENTAPSPSAKIATPGAEVDFAVVPTVGDASDLGAVEDAQSLLRKLAAETANAPDIAHLAVDSKTKSAPRGEGKFEHQRSVSLVEIGQEATTDTRQVVDDTTGEKIAALLKDAKSPTPKRAEIATDATGDETPAVATAATTAAPADVSQLLTLLDAAQNPAAARLPDTAPALSEFQALADRAGKAKAVPKDGPASKAERGATGDDAVRNTTEAGTDQVFRFARADGKGQAVSMSLAANGDKAAVKNDTASSAAKAETVTVVEARRYLGLAPAGNAQAVTSQIASDPQWARALQSSEAAAPLTETATGKVLNTLKIQMHPIDLGTVTATLRLKDDELQVELKVETGEAFRQLSDDQSAMVKALRAQGFAVDQVTIVFTAPDSSSGGTQQQAQSQTGQQGREAAGDGTTGGEGQQNGNGSQERDGGRWTGNEGTSDASSGAEPGRTGDVYM